MKLQEVMLWVILIFLLLGFNLPTLLEATPVWPDEAIWADISRNLLNTGKISSQLLDGVVPDAGSHVLWYPPALFYYLAAGFNFFGFSITTQRSLSLLLTGIFLTIFFNLFKYLLKKEQPTLSNPRTLVISFLVTASLAINPTFLRSSTLSRPEMMVLVFLFGSLLALLKSQDLKSRTIQFNWLFITSAVLVGMIALTHFLSSIFMITLVIYVFFQNYKKGDLKGGIFFGILALVPILIWLISILPVLEVFKNQLALFSVDRSLTPKWIDIIFSSTQVSNRILFVIYFAVSVIFWTTNVFAKRDRLWLLVSLLLISSWMLAYFGKIEWYSVYLTPFVYMSLVLLLVYSKKIKQLFLKDTKILVIALAFLLVITSFYGYLSSRSMVSEKSYTLFQKEIQARIPEGKTVFVASFPDASFAFENKRESYKIIEQPFAMETSEDFNQLLSKIDYVVMNTPLMSKEADEKLNSYISTNTDQTDQITAGGYSVTIVKLKNRH